MSARPSYPVKALGNRVWKSRIPAHSGVMAMRAMGLPRSVATQAGPCSGPKYRVAALLVLRADVIKQLDARPPADQQHPGRPGGVVNRQRHPRVRGQRPELGRPRRRPENELITGPVKPD